MKSRFLHLLIFITALFFCGNINAQNDNTLYFMPSVAQSIYMNPTHIGTHKVLIGLPFLSSNYFYFGNSGFRYRDFVRRSGDSLTLNMQNGIDKMARRNIFMTAYNTDLLFLGIRKDKTYLTLNITEKINTNFIYPKGFFELVWNGNGAYLGERLSFDGLAINFDHYREYSLGIARKYGSKWTLGWRAKLLQGLSNVQTTRSRFGLTTDEVTFDLKLDGSLEINSSGLYPIVNNEESFGFRDYFLQFRNIGLATDIGVTYEFNEKLSFNASILDLGFIRWRNEVQNFIRDDFEVEFRGVDAEEIFRIYNQGNFAEWQQDGLSKVLDSLETIFNLEQNDNPYSTWLSSRLILGAHYQLNQSQSLGAMFDGRFIRGIFRPSFTMAYNMRFNQILSTSFNYSIFNRELLNFGFGLCSNLGFLQLYLMTDNILAPILPTHMKNIHARFGLNFVFNKVKDKAPEPVKNKAKYNSKAN